MSATEVKTIADVLEAIEDSLCYCTAGEHTAEEVLAEFGEHWGRAHLIPGTEFVVTDEAWRKFERAVRVLLEPLCDMSNEHRRKQYLNGTTETASELATALLGHAPMRVEAVGVLEHVEGGMDDAGSVWLCGNELHDGDRIALLAESAKVRED